MLMHLQAGVSQLSNNNANLDELSSANPDHMGYGWPSRVTGATEIGECEGLGFQNATRNLSASAREAPRCSRTNIT
ncbi:hypothetical protein HNY73_002131 [Argiope bruennichi]|uniref:Uncharacterized protein n=1 Tax=Argiope bruennichi TaxID=94029 RepID=A0A8T0FWU4_ARGBR|nr:hypothetical protein HNY73_002131 [Argiope bruennichi]